MVDVLQYSIARCLSQKSCYRNKPTTLHRSQKQWVDDIDIELLLFKLR